MKCEEVGDFIQIQGKRRLVDDSADEGGTIDNKLTPKSLCEDIYSLRAAYH